MKFTDFEIEGSSVSAFATFIGIKEMDVLLDIGHCPPHFIRYNNVLISHGHQDHLLSLTRYIGLRKMNSMPPARIFLPSKLIKPVRELLKIWSTIENRKEYNVNLIPVTPDSTHEINSRYFFKSFKTNHSQDSLGYMLFEKRKKLKEEYLGLSGDELVRLKQNGAEIEYHKIIPQICYTGDTRSDIFENDHVQSARYLIIESTFLSADHVHLSDDRAHLHAEDILNYAKQSNNEIIILTHFSMRYMKKEVKEIIAHLFGELYENKVFVL